MSRHLHRWIVDSVDDDFARVEVDGERVVTVPLWLLPADAREGDVFRVEHRRTPTESALVLERDVEERERGLERSRRQVAGIPLDHGPKGDVAL